MVNKMVLGSSMKCRTNFFVKKVAENFCDEEIIIPQIHLIFKSEVDYEKIKKIEKMVEIYFKIEKNNIKLDKKIILYYLKYMISCLEEYEVMKVFSDHYMAFNFEFRYISNFIHNKMILSLPEKPVLFCEINEVLLNKK